jgi:hypothetical protein
MKAGPGRKSVASDAIKAHTDQAVFLADPVVDNLITVVLELGAQLWTDRKRIRTLEAVLANKGVTAADAVETFVFPIDQDEAWRKERDEFIETTFGALQRTIDRSAQVKLTEAWETRSDF